MCEFPTPHLHSVSRLLPKRPCSRHILIQMWYVIPVALHNKHRDVSQILPLGSLPWSHVVVHSLQFRILDLFLPNAL